MSGVMSVKRCGGCHFGKFIPQDISKRMCFGAPPSAFQTPGPSGSVTMRMARPIVNATDDACALHRDKDAVDLVQDNAALEAVKHIRTQQEDEEAMREAKQETKQ